MPEVAPLPDLAALVAAAMAVRVEVGHGLVPATLAALREPWVLATQVEPLAALPPGLVARAAAVLEVDSLARADLEALVARVARIPAEVTTVVGLGGGMALDAAKWVAWRRDLPLILAPSIVSVDACVTNTVAVRDGGTIVYEGFVVADRIIVDTDVVGRAPARLNRAGVGDLLSMYAEVNALCLRAGHSGPEEGSEHYLGYSLEEITGRSFVHGELIGLGTVLMAALQGNDPARPIRILDRCGVEWRPDQQRLARGQLTEALIRLPAFVRAHDLPWSIADEADLAPEVAGRLLDVVTFDAVPAPA